MFIFRSNRRSRRQKNFSSGRVDRSRTIESNSGTFFFRHVPNWKFSALIRARPVVARILLGIIRSGLMN
jgi:hypothetical protein